MIVDNWQSFLDKFAKPETRTASTQAPSASSQYTRSYGGQFGGSKYDGGLSASGRSVSLNHCELRRNARDLYHDSVACRTVVDRIADLVVDNGLILNPTPKAEVLGITAERADAWAQDTRVRYHCWYNDKRCMRDETINGYQLQRLIEIAQQRDNDYFIRLHYSPRRDLLSPLQLQYIDPGAIASDAVTYTDGYQDYMDGIKRDAAGKEVGYNVVTFKDGEYKNVLVPAFGPKSQRRFMLHGFNPEYAGQGRGYPRISHALHDFEKLGDLNLAEVHKAIVHASITMTSESNTDRAPSDPFEGISHNLSAGPSSGDMVEVDAGDGTIGYGYQSIPEATFDRPGVGVFNLQGNERLVPFKSTAPADSYASFVQHFFTHLCASMSMPVEVIIGKFSDNYSASRASLVLAWRVACIWRAELEADLLGPIYEAWLSEEIAAGRISAPGWGDPRLRAAWLSAEWIGSPLPSIDPLKEIRATQEAIKIGVTTPDRAAQDHNGSYGPANRERNRKQFGELSPAPWEAARNGKP